MGEARHIIIGFLCLSVVTTLSVSAPRVMAEPLPQPLTLPYVMSLPVENIPQMQIATANLSLAEANQLQAASQTDLLFGLQARLRYIEPSPLALDQSNDDSIYTVYLRQRLYDFGRTGNAELAAGENVNGQNLRYRVALNRYYIELMRSFFAVLLADLAFIRDNEAMSIAYVRLDRARNRSELGMLSDIDLAEKEDIYQTSRSQYFSSQSQQQITRSSLAMLLNRPNELVAEVAEPPRLGKKIKIPELDTELPQALRNNTGILALKRQLNAAQHQLEAARSQRWPVLSAEAQANDYARELGSHDEWSVQMTIDVPLWNGEQVDASVARRRAELVKTRALLRQQELAVQHQLRNVLQKLRTLAVRRQGHEAQMEFRDLYLDRSRALYEMEVQSDLGDSMVQISSARYESAKTEFEFMLAWAELNALLGRPAYPLFGNRDEETK